MKYSMVSLLMLCLCLFSTCGQARKHTGHIKHKHSHGHHNAISGISEPPSPPPQVSNVGTGNANNSTTTPSLPPEAAAGPSPPPEAEDSPTAAPSSPPKDGNVIISFTPSPSPSYPPKDGNTYNSSSSAPSPSPTKSLPKDGNGYNGAPSPSPNSPAPWNGYGSPPNEAPSPSPSPDDGNVLDVRKFGAVGDGTTDDTQAFKMAWDTLCQNDSAPVLLIPNGFSFVLNSTIFTGPCQSALVLQVDGTLMPPDGPESWPLKTSRRQWLVFYRINELTLQGGGMIDGRGQKWWDLPCKPHKGMNGSTLPGPCDSPMAIRFFMSSNLTVQGIRIKNSPQFNMRFDNCKTVHIESVHITAPALSPNTDGIHIENTNDVQIHNSVISNGDDCVSIGSGCYDVDIKNMTCGPGGHGISIGSLGNHNSRACVTNITVRDSVIKESDNGVRIKTWQGGSGSVRGITFSNIHMNNVKNPIIIDQFYCLTKECTNQTSAVYVSDILYENIKGTYNIRTPPMHFGCSDSVPCTNLTLSDIELLPAQGDLVLDPFCWNAYGDLQTLTIPPVSCFMEGLPPSILNNDIDYC